MTQNKKAEKILRLDLIGCLKMFQRPRAKQLHTLTNSGVFTRRGSDHPPKARYFTFKRGKCTIRITFGRPQRDSKNVHFIIEIILLHS